MKRLVYRAYRLASSFNHWALRRLTPGGWIVFSGLFLTGGMATDTEQSLGYQVFALLFCLAAAAVAAAPFFRARFSAERRLPRFGSAGHPFRYTVSIQNRGNRPLRGLHVLDALHDPRPTFKEFNDILHPGGRAAFAAAPDFRRVLPLKPKPLPDLPRGARVDTELELVPLRRGMLHFKSVALARTDPLGMFRAFQEVATAGSVTILPRRYALPALALPGARQYQHGGVALATAIGESEEFVSLRDYRPGDPTRRIHWRSWAKVGRPVVKEFQDEYFARHALILDTFAGASGGAAFEEAVSVAASFACTLETQESLLDLLFIGDRAYTLTIGRGVAHADQMLELLATVAPAPDASLEALENLVLHHAPSVSGWVGIFLEWDDARRKLIRKLMSLGVPVMVLVIRTAGAPPVHRSVDDPEAFHVLEAGRIEEGLARL